MAPEARDAGRRGAFPVNQPERSGPSVEVRRHETTPPHGDVVDADVRSLPDSDPRTAVVVVHGFKGFKDWGFFPYLCERLAGAGHLAVSFNFSLNGVGPGRTDFTDLDAFGRNTFSREMEDLHWVLDQTAAGAFGETPPERICLLGHSRGGGSCIVAAAERDDIAVLATWAAISTFRRWTAEQEAEWDRDGVTYVANARTGQDMPLRRTLREDLEANARRLDILSAAERVRAPWLVVHGADDATVAAGEARLLESRSSRAALLVVPAAGHTLEASHPMGSPPPALREVVRQTLQSFANAARGSS